MRFKLCRSRARFASKTAMELRKSSLVSHFALMSSMESDWPAMRDLSRSCREQQHVVFGAGIHPWFAHKAAMGYEERLEAFLEENPTAFVGEIGLDKVAKTPETNTNEWQAQLDVFEAQMRIAAKMKRVVSLHCVQAQGVMFDLIRKLAADNALPPRICMHSFGGSIEMVRAYIGLKGIGNRFFFSFSATINGRAPKTGSVIAAVPENRLLLESDDEIDLQEKMERAIDLAAAAKGLTKDVVAEKTLENAKIFFNT